MSRSGVARSVFGPRFEDGKPRCDDCDAARFWRAVLAFVVVIGAVGAVVSVASARWGGALGAAGISIALGAFAFWRMTTFDRRARATTP